MGMGCDGEGYFITQVCDYGTTVGQVELAINQSQRAEARFYDSLSGTRTLGPEAFLPQFVFDLSVFIHFPLMLTIALT